MRRPGARVAGNFETAYDRVYRRATKTGESAVWQSMSDEGVERRTVVHDVWLRPLRRDWKRALNR